MQSIASSPVVQPFSRIAGIVAILAVASGCQGTGGGGSVSGNPDPLDFGTELVGSSEVSNLDLKARAVVSFVNPSTKIAGANAKNFSLTGPEPTGTWNKDTTGQVAIIFSPEVAGPFTATYSMTLITGTFNPVTLKGRGAWELDVGLLAHAGSYPSGMDFGEICVTTSKDQTLKVTNTSTKPQELLFTWRPPNPAFSLPNDPYVQTVGPGKQGSWTIRYTASNPPAEESAGALVQIRTDHGTRSGVVLKGKGKPC
jgi:hypothetical protein